MSTTSTEYFCDQCGARYADPGVCTNQHPANTLKPVAGDVATTDVEPAGFGDAFAAGSTGTGVVVLPVGVLEPPVTPATTGAGAVTTTPTGTTTVAGADGGTIPVAVDAAPIVADVSQAVRDAFAELEAAAIRLKGLL